MSEYHLTELFTWVVNLVGRSLLVSTLIGVAVELGVVAVGGVSDVATAVALASGAAFLAFAFQLLFASAPAPFENED